jgi:hypothetical protein
MQVLCLFSHEHYDNNRIPKTANRKKEYSTLLIPILLLAGLFAGCYSRYGLTGTIQEKQLDYYAYTKQWNKLLAVELKDPMLERKMNLVNYALAQQGKLGDATFAVISSTKTALCVTLTRS